MTYTVIGSPTSRAMRVMWALEELGQDYQINPAYPATPEAKKYNPSGKIPALVVDDSVITESMAIVQFLADRHGALTEPAGTLERAEQDAHVHFLLDQMDSVLWTASKHTFVLPEEHRHRPVKDTARYEWAIAVERLEERLGGGPFLMGETFTVADILAAHCLSWARAAKFDVASEGVTAYGKMCRARPGFRNALERAAALKAG